MDLERGLQYLVAWRIYSFCVGRVIWTITQDTPLWPSSTPFEYNSHNPGKRHTQQIERKHLTLRTRIKRLARKTICFSRSIELHDIVIGLFVNRYEFGLPV